MIRAGIVCYDGKKSKTTYLDYFETVYKLIKANPSLIVGNNHKSTFEDNSLDYDTVFGKFYRFAHPNYLIFNKGSSSYPITVIDMYQYMASKLLALNDNDNGEVCIRAASIIKSYNLPQDNNDPLCKTYNLIEFYLFKKLRYNT